MFLNVVIWVFYMGLSSNFCYQFLNGLEFVFVDKFILFVFKSGVLVVCVFNNVFGGMLFVVFVCIIGFQKFSFFFVVVLVEEKLLKFVDEVVDEVFENCE